MVLFVTTVHTLVVRFHQLSAVVIMVNSGNLISIVNLNSIANLIGIINLVGITMISTLTTILSTLRYLFSDYLPMRDLLHVACLQPY